jgi:hypothetical protein
MRPTGSSPVMLLLLVLVACADRTPEADEPLLDLDQEAAAAPRETAAEPAPERPRQRKGTIARADLDAVLAAGPGRFLASIEVKASVAKGRFKGWEVVRNPYPEVDLVAGDVILAVNGRSLEHPLELKLLWDDLRAANAILVEVDRRGEKFTVGYEVAPPVAK